jgi:hypothetical protein
MRKLQVVALVLLAVFTGVAMPAAAARKKATIKVVNQSKWEIHHLYLSSTTEKSWGPDQLGDEVINAQGGSFKLTNIDCDDYDIKVVDEDGDECVVEKVNLCGDDTVWKITDKILLACENE